MDQTSELQAAITAYQQGLKNSAERSCRKFLEQEPEHFEALNLLAVLCCQTGRLGEGIDLSLQVLANHPENVQALEILGDALNALEEYNAAAEAFRRAASACPQDGRLHYKQALALHQEDRLEEAVSAYCQALASGSDDAELHCDMGIALASLGQAENAMRAFQQSLVQADSSRTWFLLAEQCENLGRAQDALNAYEQAHRIAPSDPSIPFNQALLLAGLGQTEKAVDAMNQALVLQPHWDEAHSTRSALLSRLGDYEAAAQDAGQVLAQNPKHANACTNLGNALRGLGQLDDALRTHRQACMLEPDNPDFMINLGLTLLARGQEYEGIDQLEKAVRLSPASPWGNFNLALARLRRGEFDLGWNGYAWRWKTKGLGWTDRHPDLPWWDGRSRPQGRVLVEGEQGIGDEIMFAGFLPALMESGVPLTLECEPRLAPLFTRSFPGLEILPRSERAALPVDISGRIALGDLPGVFRPDRKDGSWLPPSFLQADTALRDQIRKRYGESGKPMVGIAWHSANHASGRERSLAFTQVRSLIERVPGLDWTSLQYGDPEIIADLARTHIRTDPAIDQFRDMDQFAAQVAAMDLVITIDNSTAHLAGALGRPTWLLLPFHADWRWLQGRDDTPWYPGVRLIRQLRPGDWSGVLTRVAADLAAWRQDQERR